MRLFLRSGRERAIGPILGMSITEVLPSDDRLAMICAEFPLRKRSTTGPDTYQSTNIDWLLYSNKLDQLVFVELKTTDTTFDPEHAKTNLAVIKKKREARLSSAQGDDRQVPDHRWRC